MNCKTDDDRLSGCFSLGDHILVMAEEDEDVFAALIDMGEEELTAETVSITRLKRESRSKGRYRTEGFLGKERLQTIQGGVNGVLS